MFNEYLLRRLGDPPLNIAVLADRRCVDATLAAIPPERLDLVGPVNRRWLLRPFQLGTGRFHPKSYLVVTARTARLLVGSGNLTTSGLDAGREVFTVFTSGSAIGDAAIDTWRRWMRRLVNHLDDVRLAERFADLEQRLPKPPQLAVMVESPLWHNLDLPFADQFCNAVTATGVGVDELIVTAPYYDESGEALSRVARRLSPKTVRLYTSSSTNVDGGELAKRLDELGVTIEVLGYRPDRFTHAKLIGVTSGSQGWLLSGSANLSHAALTLSAGRGNVELAVFAALLAEQVRTAFLPLDATAEPQPLTSIREFTYDAGHEGEVEQPHVMIVIGTGRPDGRVHIVTNQPVQSDWKLADHAGSQPLIANGMAAETVGPLIGPLVHLIDAEDEVMSNRLVIDDPDALARSLTTGERTGSSRPVELTGADLESPLGEVLLWLHQHMVMDVTEATSGGTGGDTRDETEPADDDDLWTRLEQERLGRDPRASIYSRFFGDRGASELNDPLVELLDAMRNRAPADSRIGGSPPPGIVRLHPGGTEPDDPTTRAGITWSTSARIRVRARNVLRRWAAAQTDPRLTWVDPLAPLGNLRAIAAVFALLWRRFAVVDSPAELSADDLDDLWYRWLGPFVGSGQDDGWLNRRNLPPDQLARYLDGEFVENATTLCWLAIRPGRDYRQRVIAWQPTLLAAFERGFIDVTHTVASEISSIVRREVTTDAVSDDVLTCLTFIDDQLWCERTAETLGLGNLSLEAVDAGQTISVRLKIRGLDDPLYDARIPQLIVATRQYRGADSVAIFSEDHDWRLVVGTEEPIIYMPSLNAHTMESTSVFGGAVEHLASTQGVIADLFAGIADSA